MINFDDAVDPQAEVIESAFSSFDSDAGAFHKDEVLAALGNVYANPDKAKWQRILHRLKGKRVATEVTKAIIIFLKRNKFKNNYTSNTSNTSNTGKGFGGEDPAPNQHQTSTKAVVDYGALVTINDETGATELMIESRAARKLKECFRGFLSYDIASQSWYEFAGSYWRLLESSQLPDQAIVRLIYHGAGELGFRPCYKSGIKSLLADGNMLPLPQADRSVLPFNNGLLDLRTRQLRAVTPDTAPTWCLPYAFEAASDCPKIKAWLLQAVDNDAETVEFLRAWMAAVLHGRCDLQKFLHLKGSGGTGKGVFMRLLTALVGDQNTASSDLQQLEQNRFEAASLCNKRLAIISESDKYGGSINTLKAITGQDAVRLEKKHQQQTGSFVFQGLVVMASNESLQLTDHTSGLDRRRVTVIFNRRATGGERQAWKDQGGEAAVLHEEIPGLVNWLLELSQDDISLIISTPPQRVRDADLDAMAATNPIADWVNACCSAAPDEWTQVGDRREVRQSGREVEYEHSDKWLYANYLQWSQREGRYPLASRRFKELLIQTCATLGIPVHESRRKAGVGIVGLSIKSECSSHEYGSAKQRR